MFIASSLSHEDQSALSSKESVSCAAPWVPLLNPASWNGYCLVSLLSPLLELLSKLSDDEEELTRSSWSPHHFLPEHLPSNAQASVESLSSSSESSCSHMNSTEFEDATRWGIRPLPASSRYRASRIVTPLDHANDRDFALDDEDGLVSMASHRPDLQTQLARVLNVVAGKQRAGIQRPAGEDQPGRDRSEAKRAETIVGCRRLGGRFGRFSRSS